MPHFKSAITLKQTCLKLIAQNINYWCKDYVTSFLDEGNVPMYVVGPFDDLTSDMTQMLIDELTRTDRIKAHHLHLLLHSRIKRLNLCQCNQLVKDVIVQMVGFRCTKVTHLNLKRCTSVKPKALAELVQSLPLLFSLDLSDTKATDQVLTVVGCYCPNLRELLISNLPLSDSSILALMFNPITEKPGCKQLRKLDIRGVNIGNNAYSFVTRTVGYRSDKLFGISYLTIVSLIKYCEDLQYLLCDEVIGVMQLLYNYDAKYTCKIANLIMCYSGTDPENLSFLTECMPYIKELHFDANSGELLQHFDILKVWTELRELTIHLDRHLSDSDNLLPYDYRGFFNDKLKPLLVIRGHQITFLNINNVHNMDVNIIGNLCPDLQEIYVEMAYNNIEETFSIQTQPLTSSEAFLKLKVFHIILTTQTASGIFQIKNLLMHAKSLEYLFMSGDVLQDNDMFELCSHNSLTQLEALMFYDNKHVTNKVIDSFIYTDNNLKNIEIVSCKEITLANYEKWCKDIKKGNLDVTFNSFGLYHSHDNAWGH